MIREETSIAEKVIKLFSHEDIVLDKKLNSRRPDIWFTNYNIIIDVDEENHEIMTQMMKKKEKTCLKRITVKFFDVIPMILSLIFLNF